MRAQHNRPHWSSLLRPLLLAVLSVVAIGVAVQPRPAPAGGAAATPPEQRGVAPIDVGSLRFERATGPDRTLVRGADDALLAVLTDGARTVALTGPPRTFAEPWASAAVVDSTTWVRLAPQPWTAGAEREAWALPWLRSALADTSPDVLAVAMQYLRDAPDQRDADGLRVAGDASFGPEREDGRRAEASDFYDYLGVPWSFPDGVREEPSPERYGAADCSGFIRLVYGFRMGFPLLGGNDAGPGLPRRAYAMAESGPGALLLPDQGRRPGDLDVLQPGDLLFFVTDDEPGLDHSGIYLGIDSRGEHRFVSSRSALDGPSLGDRSAASVLDGDGHFARGFRAARRI